MIISLFAATISFVATSFIGYWVHRLYHLPISGPFYRAHMNHHLQQYPPSDFTSDIYRSAGADNTVLYFILTFLPIIVAIIASVFFLGVSIWVCLSIFAGMFSAGILHDKLHDAYHLNQSYWQYLPFFRRLQDLHRIHHQGDMKTNYGIFSFVCDRLFGTFQNIK